MHRRHPIRVFQSTHPARGATLPLRQATRRLIYFNPRTPRGVRLARNTVIATPVEFQSTHPARGATSYFETNLHHYQFQSTHPARGATSSFTQVNFTSGISIHAPREGCDNYLYLFLSCLVYFNPRTPRGVRLFQLGYLLPLIQFQSTHPARGATWFRPSSVSSVEISIHAPREGCDIVIL